MNDTPQQLIVKLAEGNFGSVQVLLATIKHGEAIDPGSPYGPFQACMTFDRLGIYGGRIWVLHKDLCGQDVLRVLAVLRATDVGILAVPDLLAAIGNYDAIPSTWANQVLAKVREVVPGFGVKSA